MATELILPAPGLLTLDGRRAGICWDERPRCIVSPSHRLQLRGGPVMDDAVGTCAHRRARGSAPCGCRVYVKLLSGGGSAQVRGAGERCWLVVEVTETHVRELATRPMLFLEKVVLLGVALPGVSLDLLDRVAV